MVTEILEHHRPCLPVPKASATVFSKGQLVSVESNAAVHLDLATEDSTFIGVVAIGAPAGETIVTVLPAGVVMIDVTSDTYTLGAELKYSAGGASTDYSLVDSGGANTVMNAWRVYSSATTRIMAIFDVVALGKLLPRSA